VYNLRFPGLSGIFLTFEEVSNHVRGHKNRRQTIKVAAGEKLKVEQIPADIGSEITIDQSSPLARAKASSSLLRWLKVPRFW
jgi:hypothetical protein